MGLSDLRDQFLPISRCKARGGKPERRPALPLGRERRHLSSPLGGEGINTAFMDAADIAWKLALVVRGAAKPSLLDGYAVERGAADHHAAEVSDEVHGFVTELVAMCEDGRTPAVPPGDPEESAAAARRRSMLDVSYAGSALVGQAGTARGAPPGRALSRMPPPGRNLPPPHCVRRRRLAWTNSAALDRPVSIVDGPGATSTRRLPDTSTAVRSSSDPTASSGSCRPADAATMDALDAHLATYLVPRA